MKSQPEVVSLQGINWVLRTSQFFVVGGQGLQEESPARDILIRIGIAWMEVGARERSPGGMGSVVYGSNGV